MLSIAALLETLKCELVPSVITTTLWRKYVTIPILQTRELSQREVKWLPQGHTCAQSLSRVFATPWAVACQAPLWGFSRPEYWSGLSCPPPGNLPNPRIKPKSPALQADSLPSEPPGKTKDTWVGSLSLLQGIFVTQESNWVLLHFRQSLYQLSLNILLVHSLNTELS